MFRKGAERTMSTAAAAKSAPSKKVVFIDGARVPFNLASTTYKDKISYDLARIAAKGVVDRTAIDKNAIDYVAWGTVVQEVRTNNLAREVTLGAGLPLGIPSHTIGQACISSNQAVCTGAEKILAGQADVVLAGGSETFSDVPIRFSKPVRERLINANKAMKKGPAGILKLLKGLKLSDLAPEPPAIKNFSTGEVMGHSSDRLASRFAVSRQDQDEFALRSHQNAAKAHEAGYYKNEVLNVGGSTEENCIRGDTTMERLQKLKPAFVKPHGTHTAGNSSPLTDGASACIIMGDDKAKELGFTPRSHIKSWNFVSVDPFEEMLLGPAYAMARILKANNLTLNDIDVFEIHEAFAGQVLSNLAALESDAWCKENINMDKVGAVPFDKLNQWGGSLSIGHPFGATGVRILTTATNRLHQEDKKYALIAACADGGQAHACLIERM
ncbi:Acetyl-CoA acetyltransferase, mitochondrial [Hondaea fermentalgiana]|uniref:acetyl-CoA C-acyltransferase n=1 Tax=Hondaea fermentalgiana TaxID=2315210 RepID=A0A2R5G3A9_9STRA|nr:Acetyl-CoA acetyltransferase, mitochondrial [Hondaea fermentalgiana]|eukprot:GBG24228.1 Acetyl-CoA acetyltransferase, mitochondrial [Hondaea fermentalgiana]